MSYAHDVPWIPDIAALTKWFSSRPHLTGASLSLTATLASVTTNNNDLRVKFFATHTILASRFPTCSITPRLNLLLTWRDIGAGTDVNFFSHLLDTFPYVVMCPRDEDSLLWCLKTDEILMVHVNSVQMELDVLTPLFKRRDIRAGLMKNRKGKVFEIPFEGLGAAKGLTAVVQPRTRSRQIVWSHAAVMADGSRTLAHGVHPPEGVLRNIAKAERCLQESLVTVSVVSSFPSEDPWVWAKISMLSEAYAAYASHRPDATSKVLAHATELYHSGATTLHIFHPFDAIDVWAFSKPLGDAFLNATRGADQAVAHYITRSLAVDTGLTLIITSVPNWIPWFVGNPNPHTAVAISGQQGLRNACARGCVDTLHHPWVEITGSVEGIQWVFRGAHAKGPLPISAFNRTVAAETILTIRTSPTSTYAVLATDADTVAPVDVVVGSRVRVMATTHVPTRTASHVLHAQWIQPFVPARPEVLSNSEESLENQWSRFTSVVGFSHKLSHVALVVMHLASASVSIGECLHTLLVVPPAYPITVMSTLTSVASSYGVSCHRHGAMEGTVPRVERKDGGGATRVSLPPAAMTSGPRVVFIPRVDLMKKANAGQLCKCMAGSTVEVAGRSDGAQHTVLCSAAVVATVAEDTDIPSRLEPALARGFDVVCGVAPLPSSESLSAWLDDAEDYTPSHSHTSLPVPVMSDEAFGMLQTYYLAARRRDGAATCVSVMRSLQRLSMASAAVCRRGNVSVMDALVAISLVDEFSPVVAAPVLPPELHVLSGGGHDVVACAAGVMEALGGRGF